MAVIADYYLTRLVGTWIAPTAQMDAGKIATLRAERIEEISTAGTEKIMSNHPQQDNGQSKWAAKAKAQDSAERKEDYMVLAMATITVAMVMANIIGPNFFKSLFF